MKHKKMLGSLGCLALLLAALIIINTAGSGASFSETKQGEITGKTGSICVHTSGGSGENGLIFNFSNLLPGVPQTANGAFKNSCNNNEDVWIVFNNAEALHALNNMGHYGEVTVRSNSRGTIFHSANLNDNQAPASGYCGSVQYSKEEFSPTGCWPLGKQYKLASNVAHGEEGSFEFTFGYTLYKGGITTQNAPYNCYPPEVKESEVVGCGLPYQIVATQVGLEP